MGKIKCFAFLFAFIVIVSSTVSHMPAIAENIETQISFGGFYETDKEISIIEFPYLPENGFTRAEVENSDVHFSCRIEDKKVFLSQLYGLVLGDIYILALYYREEQYRVQFQYVTSALRTAEDLKIFDLDIANKIIDGYFVLANDILYDEEFVNEHKFYNTDYAVDCGGFKGVFDGLGHKMSFNSGKFGLFARLLGGAVVKNVAMYNIVVNTSPVLAFQANCEIHENSGKMKSVENIYVSIIAGVPRGIIYAIDDYLKLKNIFLQFDRGTENYNTKDGIGVLCGADGKRNNSDRCRLFSEVYIVSKAPVCRYKRSIDLTEPNKDTFYFIYAENETIPEGNQNGAYVYQNVKKYSNTVEMKCANNDYTSFDEDLWDTSSFGIPIFRSMKNIMYDVRIDGEKRTKATLILGENESIEINILFNGLPCDIVPTINFIDEDKCVKIDGNIVYAETVGVTELEVSYEAEGKNYKQAITVTVKEGEVISPTSPENTKWYVICVVVSVVIISFIIIFVLSKRKKK